MLLLGPWLLLSACVSTSVDSDGIEEFADIHAWLHFDDLQLGYLKAQTGANAAQTLQLLRAAATQGDVQTQLLLRAWYYDAANPRMDYTEAFNWALRAAEQKLSRAQYTLGVYYLFGIGVDANALLGKRWLERAAQQKYRPAHMGLARFYLLGMGGTHDNKKAFAMFLQAARLEDSQAQYYLGRFYLYGRFVERDLNQAQHWLQRAADAGYKPALARLQELNKLKAETASTINSSVSTR